jgi:four helix bundle protein
MPPQQDFQTRSFNYACQIVRLFRELERVPEVPAYLARQLLRAGTSIGANLEEARGAQSRRDLTCKFSIAFKEARETRYWLRLISATGSQARTLVGPSLDEAEPLVAILTASVRRLKNTPGNNSPKTVSPEN